MGSFVGAGIGSFVGAGIGSFVGAGCPVTVGFDVRCPVTVGKLDGMQVLLKYPPPLC